MAATGDRTAWPVLLLHNIDPSWGAADTDEALRQVAELEAALRAEGHAVTTVTVSDADLASCLHGYDPQRYVVFNWCEELPGVARGDAVVAEALEALRYAYTGSPSTVLGLSWDKPRVKRLLSRHGLATPCWKVYEHADVEGWECFPAIVKPAQEHCSLGVTGEAVVLNEAELRRRVAYVLGTFQQPALVEDFIDGREFHVSLCGNGTVRMLPPAEMDFSVLADVHDRLCTFDSKFTPGSRLYEQIELRVPAQLTPAEYAALERTALAAYQALGCRDYARLDIRLRDGVFYVLDVNPNPDISSETSTAYAAQAAGFSYGRLIGELVGLAAERHPVFGGRRH